MKNKNIDMFTYGIILFGLILTSFFMYRVNIYARNEIIKPLVNIADTAYSYIEYMEQNEQKIARLCFDYFNLQMNYTMDEIKNNEETVKELVDTFNLLFIDPDCSYAILKDGTAYCSSNGDEDFIFNHDLINEYTYVDAIEKFGFSITPYDKIGNKKICYSYPLLDKNNNCIGVIVKTRTIDYLLKQLENMDLSLYEYTIIVSTLDEKPIAIVDKDGITKGNDYELSSTVENIKKRTRGAIQNYKNEDYGLIFTFVPSNDSNIAKFNIVNGISISVSIFVIIFIVVTFILKKDKFLLDFIFAVFSVVFSVVSFSIAFNACYSDQVLKDINVSSNASRLKVENDEEMQDLLINFTGNLLYNQFLNVDLSSENAMTNVKNTLEGYQDFDLLQFMAFDNAYIIRNDKMYNLITKEITQAKGNMATIYESALRNQKVLDSYMFKDLLSKECEIVKTYTMKYKNNSLVYAFEYNGLCKEELFYRNFMYNDNIKEMYCAEIKNDQLYLAPCRLDKDRVATWLTNLKFKIVDNQEMHDNINAFIESKNDNARMRFVTTEGGIRNALLFKSYETGTVFITVINLPANDYVVVKIINLLFGAGFTIIVCFALKRIISNYYKNKKEGITLHGNY